MASLTATLDPRRLLRGHAIGKARAAARVGHWARAAELYRGCLRLEAELAPSWVQYGHALKEQGLLASAELAYRTAIALRPDHAETYVQLAVALSTGGRRRQAALTFFAALRIDPNATNARDALIGLGYEADAIDAAVRQGSLPVHALIIDADNTSDFGPAPATSTDPIPDLANTPIAGGADLAAATATPFVTAGLPDFRVVSVDTERAVGWAFLPCDFHHSVLVNVYQRAQLVACGLANRKRPERAVAGPRYTWFEIRWRECGFEPASKELCTLKFQRGEDGTACDNPVAGDGPAAPMGVDDLLEAELLIADNPCTASAGLHHFPAQAIIQLFYLDYLGRDADPGAVAMYADQLTSGDLTVDGLRMRLLRSAEFRARRVGPAHRLGRLVCQKSLAIYERSSFDSRPPLRQYQTLAVDDLGVSDTGEFLRSCQSRVLDRSNPAAVAELRMRIERSEMSRNDALRELVLAAAETGRYVEISPASLPLLSGQRDPRADDCEAAVGAAVRASAR